MIGVFWLRFVEVYAGYNDRRSECIMLESPFKIRFGSVEPEFPIVRPTLTIVIFD